jgi:hypothetical protein
MRDIDDATVVLADTPAARCRFYREAFGLPARVQPELGRILFVSGSVGAITMPAQLGAGVRAHLLDRGVRLGPIVSHPRSKRWTFVIVPDIPDSDMGLFAELFRLNVSVARQGAQIALPSPADGDLGFRVWAHAPRGTYRPRGMVVVEAIRVCVPARRRTSPDR